MKFVLPSPQPPRYALFSFSGTIEELESALHLDAITFSASRIIKDHWALYLVGGMVAGLIISFILAQ